jgi:hypothetical protein
MNEVRLTHFLGINFGSSPEFAKKKLLSIPGCIYDFKNSSAEVLFFKGLTFAGQKTDTIILLFVNKAFCRATVYIKPKLNAFAIQNYREIQSELNSDYFIATKDLEIYDKPYEKNDGYTKTGISLGKINFCSHWSFTNPNSGLKDSISLRIANDFSIIIDYEDGDLASNPLINPNFETSGAWATCFSLSLFILFLYLFTI